MKKAKDIMIRKLICVREDARLKDVAILMAKHKLCGFPVVNAKKEVCGYISEKDIIASVFPELIKFENPEVISLENLAPHIKKLSQVGAPVVKDYMSATLYFVTEDTPLADILELMLEKNLKRLPVIRGKRLVGMIERSAVSRFSQEGRHIK